MIRMFTGEFAWLAFTTFFLLAFFDDVLTGFVSLYFSPAIFLVLAGAGTTVWLGLTLKTNYD